MEKKCFEGIKKAIAEERLFDFVCNCENVYMLKDIAKELVATMNDCLKGSEKKEFEKTLIKNLEEFELDFEEEE